MRKILTSLKQRMELYRAIYCDKRTPRLARWLIALAAGYFMLPFDLIPDFIPVLVQLDDIIIVPLLLFLAYKMVPRNVYEEHYNRLYKSN
ncbi:MAG: DUF1232 domain-containing protein [Planctomycetes bacterium]|nr:DUF1232 domain-containing protein [Planctomycetota bacterium]